MRIRGLLAAIFLLLAFALQGCSTLQKIKRYDELQMETTRLQSQIDKMKRDKEAEIERLRGQNSQAQNEVSGLEKARRELERRLKDEIGEYKAKLEMTERGLVITFLAEIFFDSGKDILKENGKATLQSVAQVLNKSVPDSKVAIEGHTDNDPIKHSGWKSNWELSSGRALAVLHFIIDSCGVKPERLSGVSYGEYRPVANNQTVEGRQKNRRVEIVILPSQIKKEVLQEKK